MSLLDAPVDQPKKRFDLRGLTERLFTPTDIASLVIFRLVFGAIMAWEVWRYFTHGWIAPYWMNRKYYFKYYGFEWVHPWPGDGMYWHFVIMGVLALCILFGLFYRLSTILFFLAFTYMFLLDQTRYLNHFYLVSLVSFLMIFVPANRAFSLDVLLRPKLRTDTIAAWPVYLLRFQMGLVYFYAAVAKMNGDWLRGWPLRMWLGERSDYVLGWGIPIGEVLFDAELGAYLFSYGGLLLDLFIAPLLLWKRTRLIGFLMIVSFHLTNNWLFSIGIFPWFSIGITTMFLNPSWPRKLCLFFPPLPSDRPAPASPTIGPWQHAIAGMLAFWVAFQVLVPLRHFLYPSHVHWSEEGHRFSWHMKLRDKSASSTFFARDPDTGEEWQINPRTWLSSKQTRKMSSRPDMTLQFAHFLAEQARAEGHERVEIRARVLASLNGRRRQLIIDPDVDLAKQPRNLLHSSWIVPLTEPLRPVQEYRDR
ncbi:MAG: HTTM domain-containing protein [Planctomycetota bacterium]|jgi:hypothetical protein